MRIFNPARNATYFCIRPIDRGGFGEVWEGRDAAGTAIAIKFLQPTPDPARDLQVWWNEQRIYLLCLNHPHVVTTRDQFCTSEREFVIVMELAGGSLQDFLRPESRLTPSQVSHVGLQILTALDHIHSLNVIHRDVSMKNILWFPGGTFKLNDFGISRPLISHEDIARTFIGLPALLPPELLALGYSSSQSDIYQLGIVLLTLLLGRHPIPLDTPSVAAHRLILEAHPRRLAESLIFQCGGLGTVVAKMLRRRDEYRYATAREVFQDLEDELARQAPVLPPGAW